MDTKNKRKVRLTVLAGIFFIVVFIIKPTIVPDSNSYLSGHAMREGLYPLVIAVIKVGFSVLNLEEYYLWGIVALQSILAVYAIYRLAEYIISKTGIYPLLIYILLIYPWIMESCLRALAFTEIFSEGLAYPIYYFYLFYALKYLGNEDNKTKNRCLVGIIVCFALLVMLRKQLLVLLPCIVILVLIVEKKVNIKVVIVLASLVFSVILLKPLSLVYNQVYQNEYTLTSYDTALMANYAYFADGTERDLLSEDAQVIYDYVYSSLYDGGYTYNQQKQEYSFMMLSFWRGNYYDKATYQMLNTDKLNDLIYQLSVENNVTMNYVDYGKVLLSEIEKTLIMEHFEDVFYMYVLRVMEGLVRTNSIDRNVGSFFSLLIYLLWICILIKNRCNREYIMTSLILAFTIVVNSLGISLFIFPTYRYVVYNGGAVYISILIGLFYCWRSYRGNLINRRGSRNG